MMRSLLVLLLISEQTGNAEDSAAGTFPNDQRGMQSDCRGSSFGGTEPSDAEIGSVPSVATAGLQNGYWRRKGQAS